MINITKHALDKYCERIKELPEGDIQSNIVLNREIYESDLRKMFDNSSIIYTGKLNNTHNKANFRLVDNILLITDASDNKMITLYRIGFGFGRDTDLVIQNNLLGQLKNMDLKYIEVLKNIEEQKKDLQVNKLQLEEEIKTYEKMIRDLKQSLESINTYIDDFGYEVKKVQTERDIIAKKICYSSIYRKAVDEYCK